MAMQVKAKEIVLQQCRLIKQNARKSFTFKNHNISANQTDFTDSCQFDIFHTIAWHLLYGCLTSTLPLPDSYLHK